MNRAALLWIACAAGASLYCYRKVRSYVSAGNFAERPPSGGIGLYYLDHRPAACFPSGPLDRSGVMLVNVRHVPGYQYYPITVAQYGLGHYELFAETGSELHRGSFLRQARWLRDHAVRRDGCLVWEHSFRHPFYGMREGWVSAMAQGQGMSVLLRAFLETNDESFLETATGAAGAFERDVPAGGVRRIVEGGGYFFEEYPSEPPSYVLNGFLFALWGLYEHARLAQSDRSRELFESGIRALLTKLPEYDLGYWSRYDLFPKNNRPAAPFYHRIHIRQLRVTARMTGEDTLEQYARAWHAYERSPLHTGRALAHIVSFKCLARVIHEPRSEVPEMPAVARKTSEPTGNVSDEIR